MGLPKLSKEIFIGLLADLRGKGRDENFMAGADKVLSDPVMKDVFKAIQYNLANDQKVSAESYEDISAGVLMGMVYTYMMYNAQVDANELEEQWGN